MTAVSETMPRPITNRWSLATIGVVAAGIIILFGNAALKKGDNGGLGPAVGTAAIVVILTAALFGFVVPRVQNRRRTVMILGIITVVSIVAFWSGVTPVLAAAAVAAAPPSEPRERSVKVWQGIAVAAALLTVVFTVAQSRLV